MPISVMIFNFYKGKKKLMILQKTYSVFWFVVNNM